MQLKNNWRDFCDFELESIRVVKVYFRSCNLFKEIEYMCATNCKKVSKYYYFLFYFRDIVTRK